MAYIPGTATPYASTGGSIFEIFGQMIKAAGGFTLAQICSVTGLEGSTVQNWVKRGYVANPVQKRYYDRQLARILIINALRDCMQIEQVVALLKYLNGDVEDESDDEISELQLFDYFCEATRGLSLEDGSSRERISSSVKNTIRNFKGRHTDSALKLYNALEIMCYAYAAALYKKEAELLFKLI